MQVSNLVDPRQEALRAVVGVIKNGRSLDVLLGAADARLTDERDRRFCRALAFGVLRHHRWLQAQAGALLERPLRNRDQDISLLIELGIYQLAYLSMPPHAAVGETVAVTRHLGKRWAARVVNATLRRFQREGAVSELGAESPAIEYSLPDWLYAQIQSDWPDDWAAVLAAQNARAPMLLRVNAKRSTPEALQVRLADGDITAEQVADLPAALALKTPVAPANLPGFVEGHFSVQDGAAQLATPLLALEPGQRVLDACAAPGGKAAHCLELADVDLVALDSDSSRLARVDETLTRLGLSAQLISADAGAPKAWWDGKSFDRILLDAPCSGTGVIRRHPDIKWLRRPTDPEQLAAGQRHLLDQLWPLLASGGRLIYGTCSILKQENEAVIADFVQHHDDVAIEPLALPFGRALRFGWQILPGEGNCDGFYYACLCKD
ncbi:MAG: 16S rRNA (cytosine(967)-C(5))-methyltransferase RsmB [Gammaproteobacteria bacterium]|nr:16S rRNA (cytosine(967)-C(5))-methyltransferase RsmB [Gammaproteobacteria bacterium]